MRDFSTDHRWLSINTATVRKSRGVEQPLTDIIEACAQRGIRAISPWRDQVAAAGLPAISKLVKTHGLELSGYCRGGMFPAADAAGLKAAREDNRRAVDEACELNAACLVLVVGALPGALAGQAAHKDIALSRSQVSDGIAELLEYAKASKMPLAIEPLHPMYAADRACINTMEQALDVCDALDPIRTGEDGKTQQAALGVAVDVYHVWWDPKLEAQIQRAGKDRLLAFHVCDWLTPTTDLLNDRGMMGDGVIEIPKIRGWMEDQGFAGYSEVEIFSSGNWWQRESAEVLDTCIARHRSAV
ncbi:MAG: sugar phosphate isomerase/epimerase family protein [Polaromonas sp.]|uniref:sugar phosphate isomerase/epimerase family protein n=1 Tax=Polaromonas sp. TaxID=1869339 RepID=UPI002731C01A|nr:sugar phosphate isomerase/epimerase family protein [Polaromonas sp.]MDP2450309.1 sugar phosphate isomerase/epimerase family protein [Polaromonas sp.]MDP3249474.1 sugar phosphate isomerase/epimerase family protein [Polaromonas sp.]MDP3757440.1 sugar phosphate isomerase/epimerase family protein [Polaromonas sp.]